MVSTAYSAEIRIDNRLRKIVASSGWLLCLAGVIVILGLPEAGWIRCILVAAWFALSLREFQTQKRGWGACRALRFFPSGDVAVQGSDAEWRPAQLLNGGILLRKTGWIRLRDHRGVAFGELLAGQDRTNADWRRLQVIWRHI